MSAENLDSNSPSIKPKIIAEEIKQLQRKLEEIVQPYQKPISSILPKERHVETSLLFDDIEIEACYDRFSSWEGSLSKKKIRDWLNQFETILEKNIAYLLLSKFQFLSKPEIESATRSLQQKLLDLLLKEESFWEAFRDDPKVALKDDTSEFKKWLRNKIIRYAALPSPPNTSVESQYGLWGIYERSALTATSVPDGKKIRPLSEYFQGGTGDYEISVFVFMDYTNGSGNQLAKCIREINKLLEEYPAYKQSLFIFMYVVQAASFNLASIEFAPENSETIYYEPMLGYKSKEIMDILTIHQISESEYDDFIEKYCLRASGKSDAGYRDSGTLTCHHYSCPNNTLPFFHKPNNNWEPLFRNSQTPSATRYKTR
ncbi:MAG: phosphoribosyltransferase-like protein [Nostoc sp.]